MPEVRYPLAVFAEAEKTLHGSGLHFYFTKDPNRLPEYGPHVVAVLLEEERCKVPAYAHYVRAIVRNMQTSPYPGFQPHRKMGKLEAVLFFEYLRDWLLHLRSRLRTRSFQAPGIPVVTGKPRIFTIPLGYHSQENLPLIPMRDRTLDSFFSGDIASHFARSDYRRWTSTSKIQARLQLWNVLETLRASEWKILRNEISTDRAATDPAVYSGYSERMRQSRICLAPRGSVAETFRFYEGLRAGCLVITNRLPAMPFLSNAPVIALDNWSQLPHLLKTYARDLPTLEKYSEASRRWWEEKCSEPVIGQQIADFLNQLP